MITSKITGKTYDPSNCVFMTNPVQCTRYFQFLGTEHFFDILYSSDKNPDALVFVWEKCQETKYAKNLWDRHEL